MEKWYVKSTQGKIFGPIVLDELKKWVVEGRVEPLAGISQDLKSWMLAPLKPELEMNWVVENNPGQFYGPTHRAVVDDLRASGSLSPDARFYQDDRGAAEEQIAAAEAAAGKAREEIESLRAQADAAAKSLAAAEAERDAARTAAEASENARKSAEERVAALEADVAACKSEIENLNGKLAKANEIHAREWQAAEDVLEPEIVSDAPPPSVARAAFGLPPSAGGGQMQSPFKGANGNAAAMAALEAQAQRELARMGAGGAKKFFRFK